MAVPDILFQIYSVHTRDCRATALQINERQEGRKIDRNVGIQEVVRESSEMIMMTAESMDMPTNCIGSVTFHREC
jgi:hypothetical protein